MYKERERESEEERKMRCKNIGWIGSIDEGTGEKSGQVDSNFRREKRKREREKRKKEERRRKYGMHVEFASSSLCI